MSDKPEFDMKKTALYVMLGILAIIILGAITGVLLESLNEWTAAGAFKLVVNASTLFGADKIVYGIVELALLTALYFIYRLSVNTESANRLLRQE